MRFKLFILIFLCSFNGYSENDTLNHKRRIIKINLSQIPLNRYRLSYETYFKKDKSLEATVGIIFPVDNFYKYFEDFGGGGLTDKMSNYKGFMVSLQYKKHLNKLIYISPLIKYRNLYYNSDWRLFSKTTSSQVSHVKSDVSSHVVAIQFIFGFMNDRKINFDLYSGIGLRYKHENEDMLEFTSRGGATTGDIGLQTKSRIYPTVHFGIKLGLNLLFQAKNK